MYPAIPITPLADTVAVAAAAAQFTGLVAMANGQFFVFVSTTNCWIKQGANPTATKAAGSMFWPANVPIILAGQDGAKLSVIRDSADGTASLTPVRV